MNANAHPKKTVNDSVSVERAAWEKQMRKKRYMQLLTIASPAFLLVLWELLSRSGILDPRLITPPTIILVTLWEMILSGVLWEHLSISLFRIFFGFLLGVIPAIILGLLIGMYLPVRYTFQPIIMAMMPIPTLALLPIIIMLVGINEFSKLLIIALSVFFPVVINTAAGVTNIEKIYIDVAKNYGAKSKDFFFKIALPGALPVMMEGIQMGQAIALLTIVAAEMVGANSGIGYLIWSSFKIFNIPQMYVGLVVISFFGYFFSLMLRWLQKKLIPWQ